MLNIVIFGAPGSGKGTQSERIANVSYTICFNVSAGTSSPKKASATL